MSYESQLTGSNARKPRARRGVGVATAAVVMLSGLAGVAAPGAAAETADRGRDVSAPVFEPNPEQAKADDHSPAPIAPAPGATPVEGEAVEGELLVQIEDDASAADVAADQGVDLVATVSDGSDATEWITVDTEGESVEDVAAELTDDDRVVAVQPNFIRTLDAAPNDPYYKDGQKPYLDLIRADRAWSIRPTASSGQVIAVIDSGVYATHPDLAGRVLTGRNLRGTANDTITTDSNGHGTLVAGIAAAASNNSKGIAGIASGAKILPVKVFAKTGGATDADIAQGIRWAAANGADVIVMSFGGPAETADVPILQDAVDYAASRGVVMVASTGNDYRRTNNAPAVLPGVIGVGAVDDHGHLAHFSTWGPSVDVVAPGVWILGPEAGNLDGDPYPNTYVSASGTSFAAPIVAGVVALMRTKYPTFTPAAVEKRLTSTARDAGPLGRDEAYGAGILDAAAALGEYLPPAALSAVSGDGNDLPAEAEHIDLALGATVMRSSSITETDSDWYDITAGAGVGSVTLALTADEFPDDPVEARFFDALLEVYDANSELIARADSDNADADESVVLPLSGNFKVRVRNYNGSASLADYTLQLSAGAGAGGAVANPVVPDDLIWVSNVTPDSHTSNVELDANVEVALLREPNPAVLGDVRLLDGVTGAAVASAVTLSGSGASTTLTVNPTANLLPRRPYRVVIEGLSDVGGVPQFESQISYFSTRAPSGDGFSFMTSRKVIETRAASGGPLGVAAAGKLQPGVDKPVTLAGINGIPANATAVVFNLTAVAPAAATELQVRPNSGDSPAARMPVAAGDITRMLVTAPLGGDAGLVLRSTASAVDVTADAVGYYGPTSTATGKLGYTAITPKRVLTDASLGSKGIKTISLTTVSGLPADSTAVLVNLTVRKPTVATWIGASAQPATGTAVFTASQTTGVGVTKSNMAVVRVGTDRKIAIYNNAGTSLVSVDVIGGFSKHGTLGYHPITPVTFLESRAASGGPIGFASAVPMPASSTISVPMAGLNGVAADAKAVSVAIAVQRARGTTTLAIGPDTATAPSALISATSWKSVGNSAAVTLASGGLKVWAGAAATDVVADVSGWYGP